MSGVIDDMDGIAPSEIAERWFARLMAPDCTLREREQFDTWLAQSPENALAFEDTKAVWAALEALESDEILGEHVAAALQPDAEPFMAQWTAATHGLVRRSAAPPTRNWLPAGAGIAASVVLAFAVYATLTPKALSIPYVAVDKIESVQLSDGSSVQLDLDTTIEVQLGEERRDIVLRHGRAMFEVARDADRPFVVNAGVGSITAIGTQFQVQREGEQVSVTLLEGVVGIATEGSKAEPRQLRLVPGQRANYTSATRSWSVEEADASTLTSWSQGFHVFALTPLAQAVEEINRYSAVKLSLDDPRLGELVLSGSFKLGDGKAISEALPYVLPVNVSAKSGEIVISKR